METVIQERVETVVRNIMSGDNGCGTLAHAVQTGDRGYFRRCVRPVLDVYESEAASLRAQRQEALDLSEKRRQALEYLVSNLAIPPAMRATVEPALGRPS